MAATPSSIQLSPSWRDFLAASAAAGALGLHSTHLAAADKAGDARPNRPLHQGDSPMGTTEDAAIRPFRINVSDEELVDGNTRTRCTRIP
jgi:hypothetical protein